MLPAGISFSGEIEALPRDYPGPSAAPALPEERTPCRELRRYTHSAVWVRPVVKPSGSGSESRP